MKRLQFSQVRDAVAPVLPMLTEETTKQMKVPNKKFAIALATAPFIVALFLLTRPPATPVAAATDMLDALEKGDARGVTKYLLPKELKALKISEIQAEQIISKVISPAYRRLKVRPQEKMFLSGDYEMYFRMPCSLNGTNGTFTLGVLEHDAGVYQTTLSYLLAGILIADSGIAKKNGSEKANYQLQTERMNTLKTLGLNASYDAANDKIQPW